MSNRAGILTFHRARNYGAVLQAYALWKKVQQCLQTDIIDYQNDKIESTIRLWTGGIHEGWRRQIRAVPAFFFRLRKKQAFDEFINHRMTCSEKAEKGKLKELSKKYDILITGSDQVWNNELTDADNSYFLDFAPENVKKIAYAVSMGDVDKGLDLDQLAIVKAYDLVTVREKQAAQYLEEQMNTRVPVCCDPALLLTAGEWEEIMSLRLEKKKYIFLFMIEEQRDLIEYAAELAHREGAKLVSSKKDFSFWLHPSPEDFLSWIYHAEYVVTNSFHGTVFSLLFHRPFASSVVAQEGRSRTRIRELLNLMNMEDRLMENGEFKMENPIDWKMVEERIAGCREKSWGILQDALLGEERL